MSNCGDLDVKKALIVESSVALARLWAEHLEGAGIAAHVVHSQSEAISALRECAFDVIVLDLFMDDGNALAVADFASFRAPGTRVIFVTDSGYFSDGSIFAVARNARAILPTGVAPADLAAIAAYHAARS